jgi:hypothetical protein
MIALLRTISSLGAWLATVALCGWLGLNWPLRSELASEGDGFGAVIWGIIGLLAGAFLGLIVAMWVQLAWAWYERRRLAVGHVNQ